MARYVGYLQVSNNILLYKSTKSCFLKDSERNKSRTLRQHAEKNPEARDILLQKARTQEQNFLHAIDKDMYLKVLQKVDAVLADIEQQLSKNSEGR